MEAIIKLEQIGLTFECEGRSTEVLRDFSLAVPSGRFVAIIGPSGVGKSTLLRVVAGLLPPTTGRVTIETRRDGKNLPVAMVFQDARLLPWRKVASNVGFGLEHGQFSAAERRDKIETALAQIWCDVLKLNASAAMTTSSSSAATRCSPYRWCPACGRGSTSSCPCASCSPRRLSAAWRPASRRSASSLGRHSPSTRLRGWQAPAGQPT